MPSVNFTNFFKANFWRVFKIRPYCASPAHFWPTGAHSYTHYTYSVNYRVIRSYFLRKNANFCAEKSSREKIWMYCKKNPRAKINKLQTFKPPVLLCVLKSRDNFCGVYWNKIKHWKDLFLKCHNWQKITNFNNSDNEIENSHLFEYLRLFQLNQSENDWSIVHSVKK